MTAAWMIRRGAAGRRLVVDRRICTKYLYRSIMGRGIQIIEELLV